MTDLNALQQRIQARTEYLELVMGLDYSIIEDLMVDATANVEAIAASLDEIETNCTGFITELQEMASEVKALHAEPVVIAKVKSFGEMLKDHMEYARYITRKLHAVVAVQTHIYHTTIA